MFTLFDVVICVIILLTSIISFMRGSVRDMMSLMVWIGSSFTTVYFYPFVFSKTEGYFASVLTANMMAIIPTFIISLLLLSIVSATIVGNMSGIKLGVIDRSFGAVLGFVKGLIIISVIHFCITLVAGTEPDWLKEGKTYTLSHAGAGMVHNLAKGMIEDIDPADPTDLDDEKGSLQSQFSKMFGDAQEMVNGTIDDVENVEMDAIEEDFIDEEIIQ